jgi:hypothetical protein
VSSNNTRTIELGLLCPPLTLQLGGLLPADCVLDLERMNKALNLVILRGLVPPSEGDRARVRLMKRIQRECRHEAAQRKKAAKARGAQ